jgi:hypothetical protein
VRFFDADHRVRIRCYAAFLAVAALLGFVQPLGLLLLAPAAVVAVAAGWRRLRGRDRLALALGAVFLALVHASWALPLLRQRHYLAAEPVVQLRGLEDMVSFWLRPAMLPAAVVVGLGVTGLWRTRRRDRVLTATVALTALAWCAATSLGAWLGPLARLENARALAPAVLLLALPAGRALHALLERAQPALGPVLVLVGLLVAGTAPPFLAILDARFFAVHRLDATLDPPIARLLAVIDSSSPPDARLLFESTTNARTPLSDGFPLEALVPIHTRRELLGTPQPGMPFAPPGLGFGKGELGGRGLETWAPGEFAAFLERYNVGAVVAWSPRARAFLALQAPLLELAANVHGFDVYRSTRSWGWLTEGEAQVRADYGRIDLADIRGATLGLKYHWLDGLRVAPPGRIEPLPVPGDPVPFVRVHPNGASELVLWSER